ncbi:hypothetical protein ABID95_007305 [Streptomyces atratus]
MEDGLLLVPGELDFRQCRMVNVFRTVTSVYKTTTEDESAAGAGAVAGSRRVLDPGTLLAAAMTVAAGLSVASLWWAAPTVITAFLAGRRPGRTRPTALVLVDRFDDRSGNAYRLCFRTDTPVSLDALTP